MRFEKPLTRDEVDSILSFKQVFDDPVEEVVRALCDCYKGCPNAMCLDQRVVHNQ